jgi:methionyl-tRNA formyltransferase
VRTVFLGTPAIAVPFLQRTAERSNLVAVVTNPDQPAGRGYQLHSSPVKEAAAKLNRTVWQPEKTRDDSFINTVRQAAPDLGVVVAYGKLLPKALLSVPRLGFLNVHFSFLPAYRGAAPIQWALINGESETGVSLFWLDEGMDTGPLFLQKKVAISPTDDAETLGAKLVEVGVTLLTEGLESLVKNGKTATPQAGVASKAPILTKEDGRLLWREPAQTILNRLRGTTPWPGAFTLMKIGDREQRLKVLEGEALKGAEAGAVGAVARLVAGRGPVIKCGEDLFLLSRVQPEGKKPMSGWDFWQGARMKLGEQFY